MIPIQAEIVYPLWAWVAVITWVIGYHSAKAALYLWLRQAFHATT